MNIIIDNSSMIPIYEQIYTQIKSLIINGDLKENDQLHSMRVLSRKLGVSALTVKKAYDQLDAEGFIKTVHGKGCYVSPINMELVHEEKIKEIENEFSHSIERARQLKLTRKEIYDIFHILMEE